MAGGCQALACLGCHADRIVIRGVSFNYFNLSINLSSHGRCARDAAGARARLLASRLRAAGAGPLRFVQRGPLPRISGRSRAAWRLLLQCSGCRDPPLESGGVAVRREVFSCRCHMWARCITRVVGDWSAVRWLSCVSLLALSPKAAVPLSLAGHFPPHSSLSGAVVCRSSYFCMQL